MKREAKSQTKILENHHLTVLRTATIQNCKCWQECVETGTLVHCWCECKMVQYISEMVWFWSSNSTSRYVSKELKTGYQRDGSIPYSEQYYSQKPRCRKQSKSSLIEEQVNKMYYIHIYIYIHTHTQRSISSLRKEGNSDMCFKIQGSKWNESVCYRKTSTAWFYLYEEPGAVTFIKRVEWWLPGLKGGRDGELWFSRYRISILQDERLPKTGCTTM